LPEAAFGLKHQGKVVFLAAAPNAFQHYPALQKLLSQNQLLHCRLHPERLSPKQSIILN
jgi:hypothetical protein